MGCTDGWIGHTGELPGFNTALSTTPTATRRSWSRSTATSRRASARSRPPSPTIRASRCAARPRPGCTWPSPPPSATPLIRRSRSSRPEQTTSAGSHALSDSQVALSATFANADRIPLRPIPWMFILPGLLLAVLARASLLPGRRSVRAEVVRPSAVPASRPGPSTTAREAITPEQRRQPREQPRTATGSERATRRSTRATFRRCSSSSPRRRRCTPATPLVLVDRNPDPGTRPSAPPV